MDHVGIEIIVVDPRMAHHNTLPLDFVFVRIDDPVKGWKVAPIIPPILAFVLLDYDFRMVCRENEPVEGKRKGPFITIMEIVTW